ncbi:MAG: SEC-C domain-containing protein [Proteobacteria bacterium]|nr:SEC-C domain-containing protein [Pseudomonadota bacterium]
MSKIGRNDLCFCGSGKKFKKCCLGNRASAPARPAIPSVKTEVEKIQESAAAKKGAVLALGVFVLFSTTSGDAWLLEVTDMDAIQVAQGGEKVAVQIEENPETIEINWTHKFDVKNKKFILTSYKDKSEEVREDYPVHTILSTVKKIRSRIPAELISTIHLDNDEETLAQAG